MIDLYPLWNSLRIAAISCTAVFFLGIPAAYYIARLPRAVKGILDVILTLPMVLPPTVCGYFLLILLGPQRPLGRFLANFGIQFAMTWYGGIVASAVVAFPLMYRTSGNPGRNGSGFCQGSGRIWSHQHAHRICSGADGHHIYHSLSALADQ